MPNFCKVNTSMQGPSPENSHRKRILLVDDDATNRLLFTDFLSRHGYQLMALPDGTTLLEELERFQPDLLLLDVGLPYINGLELLHRIRAVPRWQQLPVIVMSTCTFWQEHDQVLGAGVKSDLVRPI